MMTLRHPCVICGDVFEMAATAKAHYCSSACRQVAYRRRRRTERERRALTKGLAIPDKNFDTYEAAQCIQEGLAELLAQSALSYDDPRLRPLVRSLNTVRDKATALSGDLAGTAGVRRRRSRRTGPDLRRGDREDLVRRLAACRERLAEDSGLARETLAYLHTRCGLGRDDAMALGVGVDPGGEDHCRPSSWGPFVDQPRLVIPLLDHAGVPRGAQGRALGPEGPRWVELSGPGWPSVGYYLAGRHGPVVVTEGLTDALAVYAAGFDAVAVAGAKVATAAIGALGPHLAGRRLVVAGDDDWAGRGFVAAMVAGLEAAGCQVRSLDIPDGAGDLCEWRARDPKGWPGALAAVTEA